MAAPRPVMVMAGGTGGHIFPALALAQVLRGRGVPVVWLGADGAMETRLVPGHGIEIDTLPVAGVRGKGALTLLAAPWRLLRAVNAARAVLRRRRPRAAIGFGGFASGPGGVAAWLAGVPLLVLGGSQGARALNDSVPVALAALSGLAIQVRHQCGEKLRAEAERAYAQAGVVAQVEAFIDDMAAAYAWADLVVCRAGASTLAELCAAGVGSVLVPFAAAVDDHQTRNAEYLVEHGAALLLKQDAGLAANLQGALRALATAPQRRLAMAEAARTLARTDAAERIADRVLELSLPQASTGESA